VRKRKRLETQIKNTCMFCWCKYPNNHSRKLFTKWKRLKSEKKDNRFSSEYIWQKITRSLGQSKNYYACHQCAQATCTPPTIVTWSEALKIFCRDIVTQWTPTPEKFRSQVWPRKEVNTSELQAHHCMTPEQLAVVQCECHTGKYSGIAKM